MELFILAPIFLVLLCFMFLANHYRRLWERSLAREKRLNEMVGQLTSSINGEQRKTDGTSTS